MTDMNQSFFLSDVKRHWKAGIDQVSALIDARVSEKITDAVTVKDPLADRDRPREMHWYIDWDVPRNTGTSLMWLTAPISFTYLDLQFYSHKQFIHEIDKAIDEALAAKEKFDGSN
jgi:hypothetical protein